MTDVVGFCFATLPDTPKFCMSKKTYWSLPQFREEAVRNRNSGETRKFGGDYIVHDNKVTMGTVMVIYPSKKIYLMQKKGRFNPLEH